MQGNFEIWGSDGGFQDYVAFRAHMYITHIMESHTVYMPAMALVTLPTI